jgi:hypothetical protein
LTADGTSVFYRRTGSSSAEWDAIRKRDVQDRQRAAGRRPRGGRPGEPVPAAEGPQRTHARRARRPQSGRPSRRRYGGRHGALRRRGRAHRARGAPARRRHAGGPRRDHQQARCARRRRVGADAHARRSRAAHPRRRAIAGARRAARALPPRALRRARLPRWARRRGHTARRADHRRVRRVRRDDAPAPVQRRDHRRGGARRDRELLRIAVRSTRLRRVLRAHPAGPELTIARPAGVPIRAAARRGGPRCTRCGSHRQRRSLRCRAARARSA